MLCPQRNYFALLSLGKPSRLSKHKKEKGISNSLTEKMGELPTEMVSKKSSDSTPKIKRVEELKDLASSKNEVVIKGKVSQLNSKKQAELGKIESSVVKTDGSFPYNDEKGKEIEKAKLSEKHDNKKSINERPVFYIRWKGTSQSFINEAFIYIFDFFIIIKNSFTFYLRWEQITHFIEIKSSLFFFSIDLLHYYSLERFFLIE